MTLITEILSVKLLLAVYLVLALPWVLSTQARVRRLFGRGFSTALILMRSTVVLVVLMLLVGLTVILSLGKDRGKVILLEDRSLSMMLPVAAGNKIARSEEAARVVEELRSKLERGWEVESKWFGTTAIDAGDKEGGRDIAGSTDIVKSLKEVISQAGRGSHLVLITDGRVTLGQSSPGNGSQWPSPVHSVLVGEELTELDVSISSLSLPDPVYQGEEAPVKLLLSTFGPGEGEVNLLVRLDGREIERKVIRISGDGARVEALAMLPPMEPGMHLVEASAVTGGSEFTELNNTRSAYVKVRQSKRSLTLYSNAPDWDFAYLRRSVEASPPYRAEVFIEAAPGGVFGLLDADRYLNIVGDQLLSSFESSDLVVLHGSPWNMPSEILDTVSRKFRAGGTGVLLMPTEEWQNGKSWGEIEFLCPFPGGVETIPAENAQAGTRGLPAHPVISLGLGGGFDEWEELPPLDYVLSGTATGKGFVEVLSSEIPGSVTVPVIVATERSGARALVTLAGGFWKWDLFTVQFGKGPYFKKIVEGMLEWLSEPSFLRGTYCEPLASSVRRGEGISFRISQENMENTGTTIEITRRGDPDSLWTVEFGESGETHSEKIFLKPGVYRYRVYVYESREGAGTERGEGTFLVDASSGEFDDPRPDPGLLESLSRVTGGRMVTGADIPSLVKELNSMRGPETGLTRIDLRRKPSTYIAVLLIFFVELVVRRRRGLP